MRIKFKEPTCEAKTHNRYNSKAVFKIKQLLSDTLRELRQYENMKEYASWVKCNEWIIDAHARKDTRVSEEHVSQRTAWFIEQKDYLITRTKRNEQAIQKAEQARQDRMDQQAHR